MTTAKPLPDHGTLSRHKYHGCKCLTCRVAYSAYAKKRRRHSAYGTWNPFTPAEPVLQHINQLREAGAPVDVIADAAGVTRQTVARIIYGIPAGKPTTKIRRESADAILRVRIQDCNLSNGSRIDATGTRRRIQALVAAGWSFVALANEMGFNDRALTSLARAERVTVATARKVKIAYRRLLILTPEQHGVHQQARSLALRVAARERWVTAAAWGDEAIDDPKAHPNVEAPQAEPSRNELAAIRRADVEHLDQFGVCEDDIARRLGMAVSTVHAIIRELRAGKRRDRTKAAA
ncbi:hypothetical protein ABZ401_19035 [Streptomyces sp. NPDC005892]|uniref:hypothetical protein n=1 Tax=Streptomyces sp. NPDC005892 TaxID=3155593 RepID=UPI003401CC44